MMEHGHKPAAPNGSNLPNHELDRQLDAALAKYAAVEPRAGLEARILANLHTEQANAPSFTWWVWAASAATVTVVVMVAALLWKSEIPRRRAAANPPLATMRSKDSSMQVATKQRESNALPDRPTPNRSASMPNTTSDHHRPPIAGRANPKLDVFPSPQPLSTEELALARYVKQFPQEAVMIARVQEEYRQKTKEQMREEGFEVPSEPSDFDLGSDR
jgi:flagellar biosynthesis/type III secretory pathway M-ring protein FliF/YscJ